MKTLYIKQKVFSIGEKFTVFDAHETPIYWVEGSFMEIPKHFTIYDANGEFATITKKVFSFLPRFYVDIDGRDIATIYRDFSFFHAKYHIEADGIEVSGDIWDMNFTITLQNRQIASIHKEWFAWGDSYVIQIEDDTYEKLIVALVIAIDRVKLDRNN